MTAAGVRELIDQIDEIHCWGLMRHGPEYLHDVKAYCEVGEKGQGIRGADVSSLIIDDEKSVDSSSGTEDSANEQPQNVTTSLLENRESKL